MSTAAGIQVLIEGVGIWNSRWNWGRSSLYSRKLNTLIVLAVDHYSFNCTCYVLVFQFGILL